MKAGIFGVFKCTLRQLIFHQVSRMMNEKERYIVTIQSQDNFHKFANHACMNEHNFENFFGEVTT